MAGQITLMGGSPVVDLGVTNWTALLSRPELVAWSTPDSASLTLSGGQISAIRARSGAGLIRSADSAGPQPVTRAGLTVGKYNNGALHYLHSPARVDGAAFSMGAVVYVDVYTSSARDVMGAFESANGLRLWCANGRWEMRHGGATVAQASGSFSTTGWHLLLWSQMGGEAAIYIRRADGLTGAARAANSQIAGGRCTPVFGADEVANGQIGATPSALRAWDGCIADTWAWDGADVLADPAYLALIERYFSQVYAEARA